MTFVFADGIFFLYHKFQKSNSNHQCKRRLLDTNYPEKKNILFDLNFAIWKQIPEHHMPNHTFNYQLNRIINSIIMLLWLGQISDIWYDITFKMLPECRTWISVRKITCSNHSSRFIDDSSMLMRTFSNFINPKVFDYGFYLGSKK